MSRMKNIRLTKYSEDKSLPLKERIERLEEYILVLQMELEYILNEILGGGT